MTRVTRILAEKRDRPDADLSALEREIDAVVYRLYDLSDEEVELVEHSTPPALGYPPSARRAPPSSVAAAPRQVVTTAEEKNSRITSNGAAQSDDDSPPRISETDRNDVMATIRELFLDGQARQRDEAIHDVARALGYRRVGSSIDEILGNDIRTAVRRGILDNAGGQFRLLCRTIDQYTRDHLIDILLAAIGPAWWERDDAIVAAARHIGFRRTGTAIRAALKSAINGALRRGLLEPDGPTRIRRA